MTSSANTRCESPRCPVERGCQDHSSGDTKLRARLQKRIHELAENPYDPRLSSPLIGRPGVRKSRVGDWRILFTVDREKQLVQVATVDTRGQVYRH